MKYLRFGMDRSADYAYVYGMVCAKYPKMLKQRDFESLASGGGVKEVVAALEGGEYDKEMVAISGKKMDLSAVESALGKHFVRICDQVLAHVPEEDKRMLARVFSEEGDLKNSKTLLRGAYTKASKAEILELMEVSGSMGSAELERLAAVCADGVEALAERIGHPYGGIIRSKIAEFQAAKNLRPIETAMELEYLQRINAMGEETNCEGLKSFIVLQNEALVVRNLLRAQKENIKALVSLIGGGHYLTKKDLEDIALGHDVNKVLQHTPYGKLIAPGGGSAESHLERIIYIALEENAVAKPLSMASVIAFIKAKEIEFKNLRALLICKHHGIDPEIVKQIMI